MTEADGAVQFARFAYPPNALGHCGPADSRALLEYAATGAADGGLVALARRFGGAWIYLQLIAASAGIPDPLDRRVVEAYWVGNGLLRRVPAGLLARTLEERFRPRGTVDLHRLALAGGRAHHNFHVFGVYPWAGLLHRAGGGEPLRVLDACRIRWGRVVAVHGTTAEVRSRPLCWDGSALRLGAERIELATAQDGHLALAPDLRPGSWVALHWDWICDVLDPARLSRLRAYSARQLAVVNGGLARRASALSQ
jgi:hypothetical protein